MRNDSSVVKNAAFLRKFAGAKNDQNKTAKIHFSPPYIEDAFKANGNGQYDVALSFSTASSDKNRFTANEYLSFNITGISGLTANNFSYLSFPAGGHGPFYAAAHVQRIGTGGLSGWIDPTGNMITPIPEPASAALLLVGVGALFLRGRRLAA